MSEPINPRSLPEPMRISPDQLVDQCDGTVVYFVHPATGRENTMIRDRGKWVVAGHRNSLWAHQFTDGTLGEEINGVSFWVLPLP